MSRRFVSCESDALLTFMNESSPRSAVSLVTCTSCSVDSLGSKLLPKPVAVYQWPSKTFVFLGLDIVFCLKSRDLVFERERSQTTRVEIEPSLTTSFFFNCFPKSESVTLYFGSVATSEDLPASGSHVSIIILAFSMAIFSTAILSNFSAPSVLFNTHSPFRNRSLLLQVLSTVRWNNYLLAPLTLRVCACCSLFDRFKQQTPHTL